MKALQIAAPRHVQLVDWPEPAPTGPGEALLTIRRVGYCGTDLNIFRGRNPLVTYPRVPGHEIAATIAALGPAESRGAGANADAWHVGQDVLVIPYEACGQCSACRRGRPNSCRRNKTLGVQRDGALCERIVAPLDRLLAAPRLSLAELALVEPLSIGFHAARRGEIAAGETVVVIGCGAIGLGGVVACVARGAQVIAVDVDRGKEAAARACGAVEFLDGRSMALPQQIAALTGGEGPDAVVEAVGAPATIAAAVALASYAGRVIVIGYAPSEAPLEGKLLVLKELDLRGSRNATRDDFLAVIAALERGLAPTAAILTDNCSLAEAPQRLVDWDAAPEQFIKIQVDFDAPR